MEKPVSNPKAIMALNMTRNVQYQGNESCSDCCVCFVWCVLPYLNLYYLFISQILLYSKLPKGVLPNEVLFLCTTNINSKGFNCMNSWRKCNKYYLPRKAKACTINIYNFSFKRFRIVIRPISWGWNVPDVFYSFLKKVGSLFTMNFPGSTGNFSDFRLIGCLVKSDSPEALRGINASLEGGGGSWRAQTPGDAPSSVHTLVWLTLMTIFAKFLSLIDRFTAIPIAVCSLWLMHFSISSFVQTRHFSYN